jgi:hypothetical protein
MPLRRTLTAMALGFLALTLVMGCAGIDPSTARGKEALAVQNLAIWYVSQPSNQQNPFLGWWFIAYYLDYQSYLMSLERYAQYPWLYNQPPSPSQPPSPWSPSPGPSIPVSFNTSEPQNTMQMLTTSTIPPKVVPQVQTLPPPPPPPPPPVSTSPGPQPPP